MVAFRELPRGVTAWLRGVTVWFRAVTVWFPVEYWDCLPVAFPCWVSRHSAKAGSLRAKAGSLMAKVDSSRAIGIRPKFRLEIRRPRVRRHPVLGRASRHTTKQPRA